MGRRIDQLREGNKSEVPNTVRYIVIISLMGLIPYPILAALGVGLWIAGVVDITNQGGVWIALVLFCAVIGVLCGQSLPQSSWTTRAGVVLILLTGIWGIIVVMESALRIEFFMVFGVNVVKGLLLHLALDGREYDMDVRKRVAYEKLYAYCLLIELVLIIFFAVYRAQWGQVVDLPPPLAVGSDA